MGSGEDWDLITTDAKQKFVKEMSYFLILSMVILEIVPSRSATVALLAILT
jgi:hypothetical protein